MANGKENAMDADAPSKSLWSRRISRILIGVIAVLVVLIGMSFVAYEIANQVRHKFQPAQETIGLDAVLPPQDTFDFTEEFRVNTANSEGSHFIRTKISLAYHTQSEELAIELEKRNSQMRNIVNLILMSKTKEDTGKCRKPNLPTRRDSCFYQSCLDRRKDNRYLFHTILAELTRNEC